jgi:hypothetical protein
MIASRRRRRRRVRVRFRRRHHHLRPLVVGRYAGVGNVDQRDPPGVAVEGFS